MVMAYIKKSGDQFWVVTEYDYFDRGWDARSFEGTHDECVNWCGENHCKIVSGAGEFFDE